MLESSVNSAWKYIVGGPQLFDLPQPLKLQGVYEIVIAIEITHRLKEYLIFY